MKTFTKSRFLKASLISATLIALLVGCGSGGQASSDNKSGNLLEEIQKRGKVVVGTEAAFEPFEFIQDGKIVGYDADILAYIVKEMGVELEQLDLPWQGILPGLDAKQYDFVATAFTITPERADKYAFTVPVGDGTLAILKRKGDDSIQKPEDLIGKVIASQLGSGQLKGLKSYNEKLIAEYGKGAKEIKEYVGYPEAYQELETKRIDAVINTKANLSSILKKKPDTFELVDTFGEQMWLSWGVRKGDDELLQFINEKMLELRDSGKLAELQMKWFGFTMDIPDSGYLPK
jgi:polar amino acid transport system substrate-binding protein